MLEWMSPAEVDRVLPRELSLGEQARYRAAVHAFRAGTCIADPAVTRDSCGSTRSN